MAGDRESRQRRMMTPPEQLPLLSKSRFTAGLQCLKRLYLQCYEPALASPPDTAQQALFDAGTEIGALAQRRYPGGVLVDEDYRHHDEAATHTAALIADAGVPAIFEAAFTCEGVRIRVDLLVRDGDGWALIEVKSSSSVKAQHVDDAAIQLWVLEHAGLDIRRVALAHVNREYVYPGGEYDPATLFLEADVTTEARARLALVPDDVALMRAALAQPSAPDVDIGPHCTRPYVCEFMAYCHRDEPEWPVSDLPGLRPPRHLELLASGFRSILDLPASTSLNETQRRVWDAVQSGDPYIGPGLRDALADLRPPLHFIDFETTMPALPIYPGTRPFESLAFQWSDHVVDAAGTVTHAEFLADGVSDPRREFATSLIDQLQGAGTVIVYSPYERSQLTQIARAFPDLSSAIEDIFEVPWLDLLQVVRAHYYHPGFHGSFRLKTVLPVLVPDLGYGDLDIQEGGSAARAFLDMRAPELPVEERERIRAALLAYCGRDTQAMVSILEALKALN